MNSPPKKHTSSTTKWGGGMTPADNPIVPSYASINQSLQQTTSTLNSSCVNSVFDEKFEQIKGEINNQRLCNAQFDARIGSLENRTITIDSKIDLLLDRFDTKYPSAHKIQRTSLINEIQRTSPINEIATIPGYNLNSDNTKGISLP